ncbi:hypothetical protein QR680_003793 [Steinernema hermaphroditum]|uniref:non-specific serine/threonine protein kinase n=1 Tax=Steinernema hermaphroditum TaxID=289476 RepID=A0AA39LSX9_9BILA|nr:hypothetical protein QR680_003793 [Steinernema hermaphroditum]
MHSTSSRLRKRKIHGTSTVIVDSVAELERWQRTVGSNVHLSAAKTLSRFFEQNGSDKRRRVGKRRSEEDDNGEAARQRALQQQEEMKQNIERLKNMVAFEVESADTYHRNCEQERKRIGDLRALKAHNNMKEGLRIIEEKLQRKQKKPLTNDLIEDWVNFTVLHTSRLATLAGSQLECSVLPGSSSEVETVPQTPPQRTPARVSRAPSVTEQKVIPEEYFQLNGFVGPSDWLHKLLFVCRQEEVYFFGEVDRDWQIDSKLGEGAYGEVYQVVHKGHSAAMKVIPFRGLESEPSGKLFNGDELPSSNQLIPEIVITRELSELRDGVLNQTDGFIELMDVMVVQGEYPESLKRAWNEYKECRETENDAPDQYSSPDQFYIVMFLGFAGTDLESFKVKKLKEAASIVSQLAFSLMVAEEQLEFEHRDMHVGNIMVDRTDRKVVSYMLGGNPYHVETHGVKVSIIDFTISRMRKDRTEIFFDLESDPCLFKGTGDYQFDVYRIMQQHNNKDWRKFSPYTNLLWTHYIMKKLHESNTRTLQRFKDAMKNMLTRKTLAEYVASSGFAPILSESTAAMVATTGSENGSARKDPSECLKLQPKKSILKVKRSSSFDASTPAKKSPVGDSRARFDEMNILQTYHPTDKSYGHMKIEEPKTPFHHYTDSEDDSGNRRHVSLVAGVDAEKLAEAMEKNMGKVATSPPPVVRPGESDDPDSEADHLTPEEIKHKIEFKKKRREHYNEGAALRAARDKVLDEDKEEEEE